VTSLAASEGGLIFRPFSLTSGLKNTQKGGLSGIPTSLDQDKKNIFLKRGTAVDIPLKPPKIRFSGMQRPYF